MTSARSAGRSGLLAVTAAVLAGTGLAGCGDEGATDGSTAADAPITMPAPEPTDTTAGGGTAGADDTTAADASPSAAAAGEPELCEDLAAVRGSVGTMREATIGEGAVPVVAEEVQALETSLPGLRATAAEEYASQVVEVETAMAAVRTSVEAAQADTSAATLLAVTTAVRALGATVDGLVEDVGDTC